MIGGFRSPAGNFHQLDDREFPLRHGEDRRFLLPAWTWIALAALAGAIDFWGNRYNLNPDGISYVEMAQHALRLGPQALTNGLWSPGYPALLVPALSVAPTALAAAIPALHAVNFVLYLVALGLLVRLLRESSSADGPRSFARYATPFGSAALAFIGITSIGLGLLTPDWGVAVAVLASAYGCFKLERSAQSWRWAVILGITLGLGYWMKGILLPLNALLLATLAVAPPRTVRARAKVGLAAIVFGVIALPQVALVSLQAGHLTASEVGRLNYAWQTNDVTPYIGWMGDSIGHSGHAAHPPRLVSAQPLTLEFATPIVATYPLWYDPAYWYAGLRAQLNLPGQWRVWKQGLADVARLLLDQWVLCAALLAMWLATSARPRGESLGRIPACLTAWSVFAALVYSLVHVEPRYLAGFVAIATVVVWTYLTRRQPRRGFALAAGTAVAGLAVALAVNLRSATGGFDITYRPDYLATADSLHALGIVRGDRVAMVGDAFEAYAAFAAGTPITAQVLDSAGFWQLSAAGRSELQRRLAAFGVRAMLANSVATGALGEGWHQIVNPDSSSLAVLLLQPQ